jgi:MFS family permease
LIRSYKSRDFALGLLGFFLGFLSNSLFLLFPLYLEQFQASKAWVGLIMGVYSLTAIISRPFFGPTIDKRGARKMTLYSFIFMLAVVPWFHLIAGAGWLAFCLRALMGAGWGINMTAIMAMCSDLAPRERLAHSLGVIGVAGIVAGAIGPMLAEEIIRYFGFGGIFDASAVFLAGGILSVFAIKENHKPRATAHSSLIHTLTKHPLTVLLIIGIMPVIHGAVRGSVANFIALFGRSVGFDRVAPFFIAFSAAAVLTRLTIGDLSDRYGRKKVILPSALLISLNLFWISTLDGYVSFVLSGFIAGLGQGLIFPALSTYLIDFLGHQNKSLALSLYMSLFDAGMGLGSPLFGWLSDLSGYRHMYVVAGLLLFVFTFIFNIKSPRLPLKEKSIPDSS